jgi:four helix bundle protein
MHDFRRLHVWQRSRELAVAVSQVIRGFPRSDRGVVASQLRRAALSIPANIAEGCGKSSRKEVIRYFQIASASAMEVESHLHVATDLGYLPPKASEHTIGEIQAIQRMLGGLMKRLP